MSGVVADVENKESAETRKALHAVLGPFGPCTNGWVCESTFPRLSEIRIYSQRPSHVKRSPLLDWFNTLTSNELPHPVLDVSAPDVRWRQCTQCSDLQPSIDCKSNFVQGAPRFFLHLVSRERLEVYSSPKRWEWLIALFSTRHTSNDFHLRMKTHKRHTWVQRMSEESYTISFVKFLEWMNATAQTKHRKIYFFVQRDATIHE